MKLVANIENAQLNPRAADLSCVILKGCLCSQAIADKEHLLAALANALSYGGECHADLESNSQQCLELIHQL